MKKIPKHFAIIDVKQLKEKIEKIKGNLCDLTPTIHKDLSEVEFLPENIVCKAEDAFGVKNKKDSLIGYHALDNGMAFLGVQAGADYEFPIFFIIYFDGTELRAYIPTEGNIWNTDTLSAYGNNRKFDARNAKKRGFIDSVSEYNVDSLNAQYDWLKITKEIKERITKNATKS